MTTAEAGMTDKSLERQTCGRNSGVGVGSGRWCQIRGKNDTIAVVDVAHLGKGAWINDIVICYPREHMGLAFFSRLLFSFSNSPDPAQSREVFPVCRDQRADLHLGSGHVSSAVSTTSAQVAVVHCMLYTEQRNLYGYGFI